MQFAPKYLLDSAAALRAKLGFSEIDGEALRAYCSGLYGFDFILLDFDRALIPLLAFEGGQVGLQLGEGGKALVVELNYEDASIRTLGRGRAALSAWLLERSVCGGPDPLLMSILSPLEPRIVELSQGEFGWQKYEVCLGFRSTTSEVAPSDLDRAVAWEASEYILYLELLERARVESMSAEL